MEHDKIRLLGLTAMLTAALWMSTAPAAESSAGQLGQESAVESNQSAKAQSQSRSEAEAQGQAEQERRKILEEAVAALAQTNAALRALDEDKTQEALDALAVVVGKLELLVSAHPELSLAPVDVQMVTQDFVTDPKVAKEAVKKAEKALDRGQIQQARAILRELASEIVVRVVNIPLGTYPDAIKAVVPLIQAGKKDEAKQALVAALNTLVVVEHVLPLPILRAEHALAAARHLAAESERSEQQAKDLAELLEYAEGQLKLAKALGYGDDRTLRRMQRMVRQIEKQTGEGGTESDLFDKLEETFERLRESW